MNQDQGTNNSRWERLGLPGLLILTLIWSVGLFSLGAWLWQKHSTPEATTVSFSQQPTFQAIENVPVGTFRYGGSPIWAPIRLLVDTTIQSERREFQLQYVASGQNYDNSDTAIQMLLAGRIHVAQSARPVQEQEYRLAEQKGFQLLQIPVAIDGLTVAVHPELPIQGLSIKQLRAIYSGQINNWQQVGGPDLKISLFSQPLNTNSTVNLLTKSVLRPQTFASKTNFVPTTTRALQEVAQNPGGIYYASIAEIMAQCTVKPLPIGHQADQLIQPYQDPLISPEQCPDQRNAVNTVGFQAGQYPLTRYLYVIIKKNNQTAEQVGQAYAQFLLTTQGQALISKAGIVPLR